MLEKVKIAARMCAQALTQPSMAVFAIREHGFAHAIRRFLQLGVDELDEKARFLHQRTKPPTLENLVAFHHDIKFEESDDANFYKVRMPTGEVFYVRTAQAWEDLSVLRETFILDVYGKHQPVNGKTVLDIGAHIGDTAVYFGRRGANVTAFEPDRRMCELARRNIALNDLRADVRNIGIGGKNETLLLSTTARGADQTSVTLFPGSKPFDGFHDTTIPVQIIALAEAVSSFQSIGLLKIDCEGCEYPALLSLPKHALRKIEHIIMEYHGDGAALAEILRTSGFSVRLSDKAYLYADRLPAPGNGADAH